MSYLALYRKYRPNTFDEVIGQTHIVKTLQNQIKTGRIAHAYLFTGSRGTGKTSIAKIFARSVNCEASVNGSACMACDTCKKLSEGASMNVIEIDAASHNGVDNIREINEEVKYSPAIGKYKVYIIDEVHMLSTGAFNALLKTLEEPPSHVIFILATTDPQKIPVTILSRCQRFDFRRIAAEEIEEGMERYMAQEAIEIDHEALAYIARLADGGMRDALSILEQCISFYFDEEITLDKVLYLVGAVDTTFLFRMLDAIEEMDSGQAIALCDEINRQGRSIRQFVNDLIGHTRNLLVVKTTNGTAGVLDYSSEYVAQLKEQADKVDAMHLMRYIKVLSALEVELKTASNPKICLEVALLRLSEIGMDTKATVEEKLLALESKLEKALANGIAVAPTMLADAFSAAAQPAQASGGTPAVPSKLPEAVPEDVLQIPKVWHSVIQELGAAARMFYASVVPGVIEGDVLYLVHGKGMEKGALQYLEELKRAVGVVCGKEIRMQPILDSKYATKTKQVYAGGGGDQEVVSAIGDTLKEIQSKVNYTIETEN